MMSTITCGGRGRAVMRVQFASTDGRELQKKQVARHNAPLSSLSVSAEGGVTCLTADSSSICSVDTSGEYILLEQPDGP